MKKKLLSLATAGLMTVVFLTGCSDAFSADSISKTAKKFGMTEAHSYSEYMDVTRPDTADSSSAYYVFNSAAEADEWYRASYTIGIGPYPEIHLTNCVICMENRTGDNGGYNAMNEIYMYTAIDEKSADELYEAISGTISAYDLNSAGEKNGYVYTISYIGTEKRCIAMGVYQKGNTVIYINKTGDLVKENNCCDFFCKELGLVSPTTLKTE